MQIINLYKYHRADGGVTVSPIKPSGEYTEMYRLMADEGKVLTDGNSHTTCVDTDNINEWEEVDVETEATEADYIQALEELGVADEENNA